MDIQLVFKICKTIVIVVCIIATVYLSVKSLLEYLEDKDNSTVSYRNFHQQKDYLYSSVSLCFPSPPLFCFLVFFLPQFFQPIHQNSDCVIQRDAANLSIFPCAFLLPLSEHSTKKSSPGFVIISRKSGSSGHLTL